MANEIISDIVAEVVSTVDTDVFLIDDGSGAHKKITLANLKLGVGSMELLPQFNSNLDTVRVLMLYSAYTFGALSFDSVMLSAVEIETSTDNATWTIRADVTALNTFSTVQAGAWYLRLSVTYQTAITGSTGVSLTYYK